MSNVQPEFQVFLSYFRADQAAVRRVYSKLKESGIKAWMDEESLPPGTEWEPDIQRELRSSSLVLVFLSNNSVASEGYGQKEIHAALEAWKEKPPNTIFLIPVRLEPCAIHSRLAHFTWVDLFDERGWERLFAVINRRKREIADGAKAASEHRPAHPGNPGRPGPSAPASKRGIPMITFRTHVKRFVFDCAPKQWALLSDEVRSYVLNLGCKIEPIISIWPCMGVQVPIGFECLALGATGESFQEVCDRCRGLDPGVLRLCMAVATVQTIAALRHEAASLNLRRVKHMLFSMNLDRFMLDSPHLETFLDQYDEVLRHNVIFEVGETTTKDYLQRLKMLRVDFNLRFAADDLNNWHPEVREALIDRVEMTKMDYKSFTEAMGKRWEDPAKAIELLRANFVPGKPLIVEGVEDENYIAFLERHWNFGRFDHLYGQGYALLPELSWAPSLRPLTEYGQKGGSFVCAQTLSTPMASLPTH